MTRPEPDQTRLIDTPNGGGRIQRIFKSGHNINNIIQK
jgi:hypothetical protein